MGDGDAVGVGEDVGARPSVVPGAGVAVADGDAVRAGAAVGAPKAQDVSPPTARTASRTAGTRDDLTPRVFHSVADLFGEQVLRTAAPPRVRLVRFIPMGVPPEAAASSRGQSLMNPRVR